MSNSRKPTEKGAEKREKEFCGYWSGANRELASNIRKTDKSQGRSRSKNARKQWEVEGKPENLRKSKEEPATNPTEEAPVKRERRGWGIPRPNQPDTRQSRDEDVLKSKSSEKADQDEIPDYSDRSGERGTREDIGSKEEISKEEEENEEIRNFITSMKDFDIQKLRQSMKEDEVKKAIHEAQALKAPVEKPKLKAKQDSDDIEEDITEDIDDNPLEMEQESVNKSSTRVDTSYYAGKPISIRKARPISALTSTRQADPIFSGIPSYKANEPKKQYDTRSSISQISNQPAKVESTVKPAQKTNYEQDQGIKGAGSLLKRIEGLDDSKKLLLENILDKIEKGNLSKESLLSLEFLNIKKNNAKQNKDMSKHEESKRSNESRRDNKTSAPPSKQELTLPSSVESKITKITQQQPRGRQEFQQERGNHKHNEDYMSPIREEEMPVDMYAPHKEDVIKEAITKSPDDFQDSLDDKQYASRIKNEKKYHSNVEKIHVPETLTIQQPASKPKKEAIPATELRIDDNKSIIGDEHQIQFRIMSTWGNVSNAGLTEVQIFDENGDKIDLKPSAFHLRNCGLTSIKNIGKIVDGVVYTIEEDHMWVCAMPAPPTTPEITMSIKSDKGIGGFRIWNYNKSLIESIKGIKELEIIHNRTIVWFGIINRGPGNEFETYHTEVILKKGLVLPPVEAPTMVNPAFEEHYEGENIRKFSNEKSDATGDKSSSVPIWLQDTNPRGNFPVTTNLESQAPRGGLSRRDYEKSAPVLTLDQLKPEPKSILDRVQNQSQELKLEAFGNKNQPQDLKKASEIERISDSRNANRVKAHPKTNSPFKDILDDRDFLKKSDEKTPKAAKLSERKENMPGSSSKKDDNSSINSVEFFNITNFGRLKPAKRESLVQVLNLQQDVLEKIKDVQKRLDFRSSPIREEGDILSQFGGGLKEDVAKPKSSVQKVGPAGISSQKEDILTKKATSAQLKGQQDSLDSMISKGKPGMEGPSQVKPTGRGFYENRSFRIPELPRGRVLKFSVYSTWGDAYYIGLNGIEMFNEKGEPILLEDIFTQIRADPSDINCLPGYGKDPRTVDKLVDGTYLTCDDLHVWLAPFTHGKEHIIEIDFREVKTVSMIRIWNYNKSRIHSYRGARDVSIKLDDTPIFFGEIAKAPGSLKGAEDSCEYILFTENDAILSRIDRNDWLNRISKNDPTGLNQTVERPMTGTKQFDEHELRQIKDVLSRPSAAGGRPLTMAKIGNENKIKDQIEKNKRELKRLEEQEKTRLENEKANVNKAMSIISSTNSTYAEMKCKSIVITITKSWGDSFYVGLTGLEIYDGEGNKIPIQMKNLNAKPRDMNSIPGYSGDTRILDNLINGVNVTMKDENMWLIPYAPNQSHCIYINFDEAKTISGIRVWNYNKSEEGSYRGAKCITVSADGVQITPPSGVILKKAPGTDYYDFSQFIPLPFFGGWDEATTKLYKNLQPQPMSGFLIQEYDTPEFPTGFLFKIKLLTTWGDYNYIGLNGIEIYDQFGEGMLTWGQKDYKIAAEPSSVSCLSGHEGDIRTIDKLVNGDNETFDDRNMWLAPYLLERRDEGVYKVDHNEIVIMFDKPRIISCIKFWNYSKSPERGVRELEIFCDDSLLYRGYLKKATDESESKTNMAISTSVLFTKDKDLIRKIEPDIYTENGIQQKVILNNEKKVVNPSESRPQTHVTLERPTTSVKGLMNY